MDILYGSSKTEAQCTSLKAARKLFGGRTELAVSLFSRINALENAETIRDIIVQKPFRFHSLTNKNGKDLEGLFAIDVKTVREPWRIILQPLNGDKQPFDPCHIDEIAGAVHIVKLMEVSKHYE